MSLRFSLVAALLLQAASITAQPTLTAATSTPTGGLTSTLFGNLNFKPGPAGAAQTWNFSADSFSSYGTQAYDTCNPIGNCSTFPGADIDGTITSTNGVEHDFYVVNNSHLYVAAIVGYGITVDYSDFYDFLRFPMTYGSNYIDTWEATYVLSGTKIYRKGVDSVAADGYGTLITPAGNYAGALRIQHIQTYTDSAQGSSSSSKSRFKAITYHWYDTLHKDYLYTTSTLTTNLPRSTGPFDFSRYTVTKPLSITSPAGNTTGWQILPNPAKDHVQLRADLQTAGNVTISLSDMGGRVVRILSTIKTPAGAFKQDLFLDGLATGVYLLKVVSNASSFTSKLVIE